MFPLSENEMLADFHFEIFVDFFVKSYSIFDKFL